MTPPPLPLLQEALSALQRGHLRQSWAAAVAAAASADHLPPEHCVSLAGVLHTVGEDALMARIATSIDIDELSPRSVLALATLATAGQFPALAMRLVRCALERQPDDVAARLAHARLSVFLGDVQGAKTSLQPCLDHPHAGAFALWQMAGLQQWSHSDNHIDRLERWCAAGRGTDEQRIFAGFALHKELDDIGEHERAWHALQHACRLKRSVTDYRSADASTLFRRLIGLRNESNASAPPAPEDAPIPVFIVGLHRSGTSLLQDRLGRLPGVHSAGEVYTFSKKLRVAADRSGGEVLDSPLLSESLAANLGQVGRAYRREMRRRAPDATHTLDKLPSNHLLLGHILRVLPEARVLNLVRDPLDVGFSSLRELFAAACAYSYDERELVDYIRGYHVLMAHWRHCFPGRIHDVRFDALVDYTEATVRAAASFCGIRDAPAPEAANGTSPVTTASAVQVRQPVQRPSLPRSHAYLRHFGPLAELASRAR